MSQEKVLCINLLPKKDKMKELNAFRKFLTEDRGEFGQEEIDKLRDTIASMGNDEAHQKALDMVDDGIFFPEEGTSPPNNVTLGYVEDLNAVRNEQIDLMKKT